MRTKKAFYNTVSAMANELVTLICGLILPRLILSAFGSSYNGITSSITQFLTFVLLLRAGVGAVTRAALYKPLSEKARDQISAIILATEGFMRKVANIFLGLLLLFAVIYPLLVREEFDWFFSFSLVLIIGISTFVQNYFGIAYYILLEADQRKYVYSILHAITTIVNTVVAAILIKCGFGIHIVKLGSSLIFSLNPIFIYIYCNKHYQINRSIKPNMEALNQRWDALSQTVASFIHNNTDVVILTIFSTTKEISVYTVYNYVISNLKNIMNTFISGFGGAFGNMLAKGEEQEIKKNLGVFELIVFGISAVLYSVAGNLIVPFALIYTKGVNDVNYARQTFAIIVVIAGAFSCFRIPYQTIVEAAGHFKNTKNGAMVEAVLNISLSLVFVWKFGLVGVAIGTLAATIFRSVQYSMYLSKNIVKRSPLIFLGHVAVDAIIAVLTSLFVHFFLNTDVNSWLQWILLAAETTLACIILTISLHTFFYFQYIKLLLDKIKKMIGKKKVV